MRRALAVLLALQLATPVFAHPCPDAKKPTKPTLALRQKPVQPATSHQREPQPCPPVTVYKDCHSAWPWVIVGAAIVGAAIIIANDDDDTRTVYVPQPCPKPPCKD